MRSEYTGLQTRPLGKELFIKCLICRFFFLPPMVDCPKVGENTSSYQKLQVVVLGTCTLLNLPSTVYSVIKMVVGVPSSKAAVPNVFGTRDPVLL